MSSTKPHFLLFCEGSAAASGDSGKSQRGRWRFVLENVETGEKIEATDVEPGSPVDRCALISILRGLEALEQPSRVTLVTTNRYVTRGLQYGLAEWRGNDFSWERFGTIQPIRNDDLWRRIDRTLAFHQVQCRWMSQDEVGTDEFNVDTDTAVSSSVEHSEQVDSPKFDFSPDPPGHNSRASAAEGTAATAVATNRQNRVVGPSVSTQHHRNTTLRSELATNLPQRVFVDTPVSTFSSRAPRSAPATSSTLANPATTTATSTSSGSNLEIDESVLTSLKTRLRRAASVIASPFRATWQAILAVDEWLESYLRCLLLMDLRANCGRSHHQTEHTVSKPVDSSTDTQNHPFSL